MAHLYGSIDLSQTDPSHMASRYYLCGGSDSVYFDLYQVVSGNSWMIMEMVFILGLLISKLSRKHNKWDCIIGELLGMGFLVVISYMLCEWYGVAYLEPIKMGKLLLLGYLPGRVLDWILPLLKQVRGTWDRGQVPMGKEGCRDCQILEQMIKIF